MRHLRWSLLAVALAVGGVGCSEDRPPREMQPAQAHGCPDLAGSFRIPAPFSESGLSEQLPGFGLEDWSTLTLRASGPGRLQAELRRPPGDARMQAMALRSSDPSRYMRWRAHVLAKHDGAAADRGGENDVVAASLGPRLVSEGEFHPGACRDGWIDAGTTWRVPPPGGARDEESPRRSFTSRLSRAADGALLLRTDVSVANDTGGVFFGQPVVYYTHDHTRWRRFEAVDADAVPALPGAAELPPVLTPAQRERRTLALRFARQGLQEWLRLRVGPEAQLERLQEVVEDEDTATQAPERLRLQISGSFAASHADDPIVRALRANDRISQVIERSSEIRADGRREVAIEFSYRYPEPRL